MAPRTGNLFIAITCAAIFSIFSSTAYAQLCRGNSLGCLQEQTVCSPVTVNSGSTGKCETRGPAVERTCECVGAILPPPMPSIQFVITTDGDDLRGDSSATATLFGANGAMLQVITLKAQNDPGWGDNTTNSVKSELNPPASALDHIDITLTSHPNITEGPDNWNIQEVQVIVFNTDIGTKQLADASGNPFLVRLTADVPTFSLPLSVR
jgi:hypothetical protein